VNAVLRSLAFEAGDEIVVTNHVYNACLNVVQHVAATRGARVVIAEVPFPLSGPGDVLEAVLGAVTARTRLALLDHVTSPSGLIWPVADLVRELRERGVETMIDGAHAPGMLPLDLAELGAAYYTGNLHKWVCAPKGAAFLHARRDLQAALTPPVISHGANSPRRDRTRFRLEFDYMGTDDPTPFLCVPACLAFLRGVVPGGIEEVRRRNHELVLQARDLVCEACGCGPPAPDAMLGSLASIPLPRGTATSADVFAYDPLQRALFEKHRIEVPVFTWPEPPQRQLRVSAAVYNELAEYEALAAALVEELAAGKAG